MCELLVGLPAVVVLGVDADGNGPLRVHVETRLRPLCSVCAGVVVIKDRPSVELVDLPCFGRSARLVRRWSCPDVACVTGSWTDDVPAISARRLVMTDQVDGG